MNESIYGVQFALGKNYAGRSPDGTIRISEGQGARIMTKECAEQLVRKLKPRYPSVEIVELLQMCLEESSDVIATRLSDLSNEIIPIKNVLTVVTDCVNSGIPRQDILDAVSHFLGDDLQPSIRLNIPDTSSREPVGSQS